MDAVDKIKRLLTNEYNVVYHQLSSEEQTKMWATVNPEIADKVVDIFQQEIAKAQVGELKSLQDCKNVAGETLVNMGTDVWIADRIAELSQTLKDKGQSYDR